MLDEVNQELKIYPTQIFSKSQIENNKNEEKNEREYSSVVRASSKKKYTICYFMWLIELSTGTN